MVGNVRVCPVRCAWVCLHPSPREEGGVIGIRVNGGVSGGISQDGGVSGGIR